MKTDDPDLDARREEIRQLILKHARGDVRDKEFQPALAERTVALYRAFVQRLLAEPEPILAEHHVVFSHTRLTQSMLREPEQEAVSLFATDRRLLRLRSVLVGDRPPTCDEADQTQVDEIAYGDIGSLKVTRRIRPGETGAGLVLASVAALFHSWLSLTGPLLVLIGTLGILHGLLLPTRWVEIRARGESSAEPIRVHRPRKKSARRLLNLLREQTGAA
ncbi:MAG: hypothetical protein AB1640_13635 [bacterium]